MKESYTALEISERSHTLLVSNVLPAILGTCSLCCTYITNW